MPSPEPINRQVRRLGQLLVSPQAIVQLCRKGTRYEVSDFGIPEGARFVGCGWDGQRACFALTVEHESFAEILEGDLIPLLSQPVFRQVQQL